MSQSEYSGLTKSEKRRLADPKGRDASIQKNGYPKLEIRYNQGLFKVPKHGAIHGLPCNENDKTLKTEKNAIGLINSLVDMANKPNIIWYRDGEYQGGTAHGCKCIHLFDLDTNIIAVYQKQPDGSNLFLTTCELDDIERDHLKASNGNFVTKKILNQQKGISLNSQTNINNENINKNDGLQ